MPTENSWRRDTIYLYLFCAEVDVPPLSDEVLSNTLWGVGARGDDDCVHFTKIAMLPGLHWTNEMNDLCISTESGVIERKLRSGREQEEP